MSSSALPKGRDISGEGNSSDSDLEALDWIEEGKRDLKSEALSNEHLLCHKLKNRGVLYAKGLRL